jgi:hypothetical protein
VPYRRPVTAVTGAVVGGVTLISAFTVSVSVRVLNGSVAVVAAGVAALAVSVTVTLGL